jgi:hypothetical protein
MSAHIKTWQERAGVPADTEAQSLIFTRAGGLRYLEAEIRELRAALAAAALPKDEDGERYRWLRSDDIEVLPGQREICVYLERLPFREDQSDELLTGTVLDAAIDAARAAAGKEGQS